MLTPWKEGYDQPRKHLKSRDITLSTKVCLVKAMVFPVVMYRCELDHKDGWTPKNRCFQTVVLEKTLKSPLDCKEIQPVNPKGINPEYSLEVLMLKYTPILWPPNVKSWLTRKDTDAGKDWRQKGNGQRMRWLDSIPGSVDMSNLGKVQEIEKTEEPGRLQCMGSQRVGHDLATE